MDLQEYFKRIGFSGPFEKPDLSTLQQVHRLHVMSIPYENLSVHCQEHISMDLLQVFSKLVHQQCGGWCCESNLLFSWALGQMGYAQTILGSQVYNPHKHAFSQLMGHLIMRVQVEGRSFIADTSFGLADQILEPLELVSGKEQPQPGGIFCLREDGDMWVLEKTSRKLLIPNEDFAKSYLGVRGPINPIYCFTLQPRQFGDFHAASHFLQTHPDSLYTNKSICSLPTPMGYRALVGWVYREVTFEHQDEFDLMEIRHITDDEVQDVLMEKFGLPIVHNLTLKNNRIIYTMGVMDLQEYFQRIGFSGPFEKPDLSTLQQVHRLNVMSIPFENVCAHSQEQFSSELPQIYSKLVQQRRGGCCYESNQLLFWVLEQMGYACSFLGARVYNFYTQVFSEKEAHLIVRVEVDGSSYIADTSFGLADQIWEPLELVSGKEQPQPGGTFCLRQDGDTWTLERTARTPQVPNEEFAKHCLVVRTPVNKVYCFTLEPRKIDDLRAVAEFVTTSPKSLYTNKSLCSLATPTGYRGLVGWVYVEVTFAYQEKFDLMEMRSITDDEVQDLLREKFSLPTIPNLQLKCNRGAFIM